MSRASISVVIPAYNERKTIREIVARVKAVPREKEIIIVDDYSTDGTRKILQEFASDPEVRVVYHEQNRGKGAALRTGFEAAKNDVVIVQDADLEYDPSDYEVLLRPIDAGRADVVFGSRFLHGERRVLYFWHSVGNKVLTLLSNIFTDLNLTDRETCYKVFKRPIIQNISLESDRFGFEPEITAKLARLGCTIYEVPVNYYGRSYSEGKKITWRDGVAALGHIVRFSLAKTPFIKDSAAIREVLVSPEPETDVGVNTLEAFENADRYNQWIFERLRPHVGKRVMEVGAGIGNIVSCILKHPGVERVVATDIGSESLRVLKDRFGDDDRLVTQVWNAEEAAPPLIADAEIDTIICSNVLEHIKDHQLALEQMRTVLKPGGRLLLLVPAHMEIFSGLDEDLGHYRRYDEKSLRAVLTAAGFAVDEVFEHNFVGALGWWWAGKVRRQRSLRTRDTKSFDKLVPYLKQIDPLLARTMFGVSVIAISRPREMTKVRENSRIDPVIAGASTGMDAASDSGNP
ncbi:MAG: glycosyltransferase [Deltaproteobacteria bacterium]|nr:glycosyltransferase [Deltaproteobacteria bacterium]